MRGKLLIFVSILFVINCASPTIQETRLYPNEADFLYNQMLLTFQELGWTIKHTDKASMTIQAQTLATPSKTVEGMASVFGGGNTIPYQATAIFQKKDGETNLNLTVTQPGNRTGGWQKKWTEKIMEKFNEKIR